MFPIISSNVTSIVHDQYTDIYSLVIYIYTHAYTGGSRGRSNRNDFDDDSSMGSLGMNSVSTLDGQGKVLAARAGIQIDSAVSTVEGMGEKKKKKGVSSFAQSITVVESDNGSLDPDRNQFPDAFKCT